MQQVTTKSGIKGTLINEADGLTNIELPNGEVRQVPTSEIVSRSSTTEGAVSDEAKTEAPATKKAAAKKTVKKKAAKKKAAPAPAQ